MKELIDNIRALWSRYTTSDSEYTVRIDYLRGSRIVLYQENSHDTCINI